MDFNFLPSIRAQFAMNRHDPANASISWSGPRHTNCQIIGGVFLVQFTYAAKPFCGFCARRVEYRKLKQYRVVIQSESSSTWWRLHVGSDEQAVRELHSAWIDAVNSGDLVGLLSSMAADVIFLGPGETP